jgi:hypothetical protein
LAKSYTLSDYPVVIDPTVAVLELRSGPRQEEGWTQWPRLDIREVQAKLHPAKHTLHWFGDKELLADCEAAIGYDGAGIAKQTAIRLPDGGFQLMDMPPEITGQADVRPFVRLIFKNERARLLFLRHLQNVSDGVIHNPSLALLLEQLEVSPFAGTIGVQKDIRS